MDILSHRCFVDTKRDHGGQENNSRLCGIWGKVCDTKRDHGGQENNSRLCGIWGKIWRALGTKTNTKVTLRYGAGVALTLSAVQVDILSHRCFVDTKRDHGGQENNSRLCGIWGKVCDTKRDHGGQENNSRLCGIWGNIWRALSTKTNTKVTLRYGAGVALTLSAVQVDILSHRCFVDTKRDHGGQENNSRLCGIWGKFCDTKRDHGGQENNSRICGIWGKIWRALGTKTNTKVTLRYGAGVALTLSAVQVDILSHRCFADTKRDHGGQENNSRSCGIWGKFCDTKRDHGGQENNSRLCGIWGKIWRALGTKTNTKVTLCYGAGVALTLSAVQVDILSHRCFVDTKRDHGGQENNSRLCGIWGNIWRALGTKTNTKVTLRYGAGVALTLSAVQVDILSHRCFVDTKRDHGGQENSRLCGIWGKIWRALGTKTNTKVTLCYGAGVALTLSAVQVDILSHRCFVDTKRDHGGQENNSRLCGIWGKVCDTKRDHGGQENNSRICGIWGKIWRALGTKTNTKVTLRYGAGVALTLSAVQVDILSHRCSVDTKRDHGGQENNSRSCGIWGKFCDTKRDHGGQENNSRLCGIWGKIWRALGTKTNTKVTLQQEESLRLLKVWVMTWSVPDRFIMSILRGRCGTVNYHFFLNLIN